MELNVNDELPDQRFSMAVRAVVQKKTTAFGLFILCDWV